ncbi:hypothetical protein UFOVP105_43 [uncultured Caudovirales phage]|uniref:Uncharacterized protein n=1 Tax=uncultured Caudovirales phage TaxID=2100421 RepID=A0A6J5L764_9CAUD|nr:hypothetical protein UFOVP105_43 [uncultured Caudovirales phage]
MNTFKTKFKMALPNAVLYVESLPVEIQNKVLIFRDLTGRNRVDYLVCHIVKQTYEDTGVFITSDDHFLKRDRYILALCEINNKNLKT